MIVVSGAMPYDFFRLSQAGFVNGSAAEFLWQMTSAGGIIQ